MPALPFRLGYLCRRCPELHGQLRSAPYLDSRRWHLTSCKTAANQEGIQSELQTRLRYFPYGLSGEVWHRDVSAFVHGHGDGRLAFRTPRFYPGGLGWG